MPAPPTRPTIALAIGDPGGISPELTARVIVDPEVRAAMRLVVIGDRRVLEAGAQTAGLDIGVTLWRPGEHVLDADDGPVLVDLASLDPASIRMGEAAIEGGRFALANFRAALAFAREGGADATAFTPFNKNAMAMALPGYDDEIGVISQELGTAVRGREFNILGQLWNARITSHMPLKDVARHITRDAVVAGIELTDACMRRAGFARPRIAVAGLNPHAGDGGNFGREEIDEITPAVRAAQAKGFICDGPFPADTVFLRARRGDFDAVQTMYHDQGQIAMKLMGFEKGVTFLGGYPFPITTPAHGTAYDIAGRGIAGVGATREAVLLAARMAEANGRSRPRLDAARRAAAMTAIAERHRIGT